MIIKPITVFEGIETNAYFYIDEISRHGFLIDPGAEAAKLEKIIHQNNWIIEKILLTHGHFDHIGAVRELELALNIPYYSHSNGKNYLTDPAYNLSAYFGKNIVLPHAHYFNDNDIITLDANPDIKLQIIHTPGHTSDSVIFYHKSENLAFVGDTIFKGSVGRTDFPGGDQKQLKNSILKKILTLPEQTTLYSGHSEPTNVAAEKNNFVFFF